MSTLTPHAIRLLAAVLTVGLLGLVPMQSLGADTPEQATEAMVSEELQLLKEEETVSIAVRHEQPISEAPSNVYVITDEDIRQSGATDLPTVLRRIPGIEVIQMSGADFNVSARGDNQPSANKMLVLVDGRSIYIDVQAVVFWKAIPVTLPEIKRIEVLIGPASVLYGFDGPIVDVFQLSTPFTHSYANIAYERPNFFLRAWWSEWNASTTLITNPLLANFDRLTDHNGSFNNVPFIGNTYNVEAQHGIEF